MSQPNNQNPEKKRASHKGKDPDLVKYFKCSACNTSFHMSEGKIKNHRRTCTNQTVKCWFPNPGSQTKCDMFFVHQRIGASFVCLRCKKTGITQDNALQKHTKICLWMPPLIPAEDPVTIAWIRNNAVDGGSINGDCSTMYTAGTSIPPSSPGPSTRRVLDLTENTDTIPQPNLPGPTQSSTVPDFASDDAPPQSTHHETKTSQDAHSLPMSAITLPPLPVPQRSPSVEVIQRPKPRTTSRGEDAQVSSNQPYGKRAASVRSVKRNPFSTRPPISKPSTATSSTVVDLADFYLPSGEIKSTGGGEVIKIADLFSPQNPQPAAQVIRIADVFSAPKADHPQSLPVPAAFTKHGVPPTSPQRSSRPPAHQPTPSLQSSSPTRPSSSGVERSMGKRSKEPFPPFPSSQTDFSKSKYPTRVLTGRSASFGTNGVSKSKKAITSISRPFVSTVAGTTTSTCLPNTTGSSQRSPATFPRRQTPTSSRSRLPINQLTLQNQKKVLTGSQVPNVVSHESGFQFSSNLYTPKPSPIINSRRPTPIHSSSSPLHHIPESPLTRVSAAAHPQLMGGSSPSLPSVPQTPSFRPGQLNKFNKPSSSVRVSKQTSTPGASTIAQRQRYAPYQPTRPNALSIPRTQQPSNSENQYQFSRPWDEPRSGSRNTSKNPDSSLFRTPLTPTLQNGSFAAPSIPRHERPSTSRNHAPIQAQRNATPSSSRNQIQRRDSSVFRTPQTPAFTPTLRNPRPSPIPNTPDRGHATEPLPYFDVHLCSFLQDMMITLRKKCSLCWYQGFSHDHHLLNCPISTELDFANRKDNQFEAWRGELYCDELDTHCWACFLPTQQSADIPEKRAIKIHKGDWGFRNCPYKDTVIPMTYLAWRAGNMGALLERYEGLDHEAITQDLKAFSAWIVQDNPGVIPPALLLLYTVYQIRGPP